MTIVFAKEFTGLEDALGQTDILYNEQGTSWGAVNPAFEVLFVWVATISGVRVVVGRIDARGHDHDTKVSPIVLSTTTGIDGVRCCYNPASDGWVVVFNAGTTIYYRTFQRDLTPISSDTALPENMPGGFDLTSYNLGCDDLGRFSITWPGKFIRIIASTNVIDKNILVSDDGGARLHVHLQSGIIDVTRIYTNGVTGVKNLVVDRYDSKFAYRYTVVCASSTTLSLKLHDITARYGNEGFIVAYLDETSGDNIHYRAFSATGTPLYNSRIVSGTGHIDTTSNQARLHFTIGERPRIDDQWHTFAIRAVSTNESSNRVIALIEPQNFNPQTIDKEEFQNMSDVDTKYGEPVVAVNQFELRHLKPDLSDTPSMSLEVYVRESIWMSLWRIEHDARVFVDDILDPDAVSLVESVYSSYPGTNRLAGDTGTDDADYTGAPGRSSVNPDTTSFASYWGTQTNEDNVFIGGPVTSMIAESFENNPNCFAAQLSAVQSELGLSAFSFFTTGRNRGWSYGTQTPELRITIGGITHILQRHPLAADNWYQVSTAEDITVDYAIIIRLPLTSTSTQEDRSFTFIAGINANGTEAASYVYQNAVAYKLGSSSAHLVVAEYDQTIISTSIYQGGTTGNIRAYPLKISTVTDFEGMR